MHTYICKYLFVGIFFVHISRFFNAHSHSYNLCCAYFKFLFVAYLYKRISTYYDGLKCNKFLAFVFKVMKLRTTL